MIPPAENASDQSVGCLGISRQCPDPPPENAILLPFSAEPRSRPMTGLRQRSAVFVDWGVNIRPEEIVNRRVGHVPAKIMKVVVERWNHLKNK
jgi:hypothetical protein